VKTKNMEQLTKEVKGFSLKFAKAVGIADADFWKEAPEGYRPQDTLEDAKTVVVFIYPVPESIFLAKHRRTWQRVFINARYVLDQEIGLPIARFIEDKGYAAVPIAAAIPVDIEGSGHGLFGDISHRHAAVGAGLGEISRSQLLLTPQWGPRVWVGSVVTAAPLIPDTPFEPHICNTADCGEPCIRDCPVSAISEGKIDKLLCANESLRYGIGGFLKHFKEIFGEEDPERRKKLVTSPMTRMVHHHLALGTVAWCVECMRACPIGKKLGIKIENRRNRS
jgi:epoxyqueuosine reductase QueG